MSGLDLHVFTLKFLYLKNIFFSLFWAKIFCKKGIMQLFSEDAIVFSGEFKFFLTPKKWKNGPQKLLIIGPDPFVSQYSPQPRIDFSYYESLGPDIGSLICVYRLEFSILVDCALVSRKLTTSTWPAWAA